LQIAPTLESIRPYPKAKMQVVLDKNNRKDKSRLEVEIPEKKSNQSRD